jgi:hypothetical protein
MLIHNHDRFETYNIFALLVGTLIFDVVEDQYELVMFQVILVLLFIVLCLFAVGSQVWHIQNLKRSATSLDALPATQFNYHSGTVVLSQTWKANLPGAVLLVNPMVEIPLERPSSGLANII